MIAIIGAAGKVGFTAAKALRQADVPVRAILRDATKAKLLEEIGCEIATADLLDISALTKAMENAETVQVILPTNPQAKDGAQEMQDTIESIATALEKAKPKRVLAVSDYGAHVTTDIGLPTVFRTLEERLRLLPGQKIILRSAPHMQNWARAIPAAIESGILTTLQDPVEKQQPTISAHDLGLIAAELLLQPIGSDEVQVVHAEGPQRYSAEDVAAVLSGLAGKSIKAMPLPQNEWRSFLERGLSPSLADLLIKTNNAQNEGGLVDVPQGNLEVQNGTTELVDALRPLVLAK